MATPLPILLMIPTPFEAELVKRALLDRANSPFDVLVCGIGPDQARAAASRALQQHSYQAVLIAGFCGGLSGAAALGSTWEVRLHDESLLEHQQRLQRWPLADMPSLTLPVATLLSSESVVHSAADKQQLYARTGADLVDMETAAVAKLALQRGLPWRGIRCVSDTAQQTLPLRALDAGFDSSTLRSTPAKLIASLLRHPADLKPFFSFILPLNRIRKQLTQTLLSGCPSAR